VERVLPEYHDTRAAEPKTTKAAHAQAVLEIFAGKKMIENRVSKERKANISV